MDAGVERSPDLVSPLMEESVVNLNYSSMRPDIEKVGGATYDVVISGRPLPKLR